MRAVQVDAEARTMRVQAGATIGDLDRQTQPHGLAVPMGVVTETGVAGLTLGGGLGWLRRKYVLSCDNLLAAEVVIADGSVVTADAQANPALLWALQGGGGDLGVVTSFVFRAHPVGRTSFSHSSSIPPRTRPPPRLVGPWRDGIRQDTYGPNLDRLRALKRHYQPHGPQGRDMPGPTVRHQIDVPDPMCFARFSRWGPACTTARVPATTPSDTWLR